MSNTLTVLVNEEQVGRVARLGKAAVWIDVAIVGKFAHAEPDRPIVIIGDPERDASDDPRIAYIARAAIPDDQLQAVLAAVGTGTAVASPAPAAPPKTADEARRAQQAFAASRMLAAASDLAATEAAAVRAVCELLDVETAYCLYYDAASGALWSEAKQRAGGDERRAIGGMVGWSAVTGLACGAPIASEDPRYVAAIDDPDGDPAAQLMVQPILGADSRVHAVLVAIRRARRRPLNAADAAQLARLATLAAPLLDQLSIHIEGQELLEQGATGEPLFRAEAVAAAGPQGWGDVVRVAPRWLGGMYWLLVLLLVGSGAFVALGKVATYSSGPAVIRSTARTSIAARTAGNIAAVDLAPGDRVERGAVIARLDDNDQRAAVERFEREFDAQLRNHMADSSDAAADGAVRTLRLELEQARTALDDRAIRATTSGVLSDLRVRPGQHVEPGDVAAAIVDGNEGLEVVALLPGEDRPQLAPGMALRLELAGWRYAYQSLAIDSVSSDVIAPSEARRVLGAEVADGLHLAGPVVVVHGRLATPEFVVDGKTYRYHDGMLATAEVPVRTERIIVALLPALRRL